MKGTDNRHGPAPSALGGLKVVDMSGGVASGIVGMFLGDFGADVVLVEPPAGSADRRRAGFAVRARNKRSVVVDPAQADDVAWLAAMVAGAHVCIVDDRAAALWSTPTVARAAAANRPLVTIRLPAYTDAAAPWAGGLESNRLLAARLGMSRRQSSYDGGPIDSIAPLLLYVHGLWAAACGVSALYECARSGHGQVVTVSGMRAAMEANVQSLSVDPELPDPPTNIGPTSRHPTYRPIRCAGGRWLASGALGHKFELTVMEILGLTDMLDDPRLAGNIARLASPPNLDWSTQRVNEAAAQWDRDELVAAMLARGVPAGPMQDRADWFDDEQFRAIGMRIELQGRDGSDVVMPGVPIVLTRTPGRVTALAPDLGEHQGLAAWPPAPSVTGRPPLSNGPLAGLTVLNLGTFVATPYAGYLLAELGARVVKVEPLTGDPFREQAYTFNRGMESLAIDLKSTAGRELMHRLVAASDVVVDGMRPGVMQGLGLDHATLAEINPRIVTLSLSAYGEVGPRSQQPGVDMVIQAESGMMLAQGAGEPAATSTPINDVTSAAMSTLAVVLALVERERSGQGQHVWDSLAATSGYLQMDDLVRFRDRPPVAQGGRDFSGPGPVNRYYRTADGWIVLDAEPGPDDDDVDARLRAAGLPGSDQPDVLVKAIADEPTAAVLERLFSAGVPAAEARVVNDVIRDAALIEDELIHARAGVDGGVFVVPGRMATFSRTPRFGPLHPPGVGQHTRSVLGHAGLDDDEVDAALALVSVAAGGPMPARLTAPYR